MSKSRVLREDRPLTIDGQLIPANLRYSSAYVTTSYGDGHVLNAMTVDQKAALFVQHLSSVGEYSDHPEKLVRQAQRLANELLMNACGYTSIADVANKWDFSASNDEDSSYIDEIFEDGEEGLENNIGNHIRNVILSN